MLTDSQLELFRARPDRPELLAAMLRGRGWVLSRDLLIELGRPVNEDERRWLRKLAEESYEIISGQRGYCHVSDATADEVNHACNALESQAGKMSARALRLRRRMHAAVG